MEYVRRIVSPGARAMTDQSKQTSNSAQPALSALLTRYLRRETGMVAAGLDTAAVAAEIIPFGAVAAQLIEPRFAWKEALTALRNLYPEADEQVGRPPHEWAAIVAGQES